MKKLALIFALSLGSLTAVQAQNSVAAQKEQSAYEAVANKETDKLDKLVNLSAEQRQKIYNINLALAQRTAIIEESENIDKTALFSEVEKYRSEMYLQTLTPEQAVTYKKTAAK